MSSAPPILEIKDRKQQLVADLRRSEILAAATQVFGDNGFEATRMEEIARAAQLAKGTLYLYFQSKDEIYQATVQQAIVELAALTEEHIGKESHFAGRFAAFIRVRIAFWQEKQSLYRVILSLSRDNHHRQRSMAWQLGAVRQLQAIFETAAAAGEIPPQDFLAAAWTTMDAIRGVNERRVFADQDARSTEDDTLFLTQFLLTALGAAGR
ncbi:transcriptional regulator, TetR family [Granulicella rosea]|uniref:Transcriptional regulator, TetR family n=1 Tax=Granulicella rosea TaxID=474952 RepID=A0A239IKI6_9BACT|nr:TetR/AcrR family transcriptional regulator [Granulicella rosea]SNS94051.1 transcriptional regulator, TetR family [Granulicella rosea]